MKKAFDKVRTELELARKAKEQDGIDSAQNKRLATLEQMVQALKEKIYAS